MSCSPAKVNRCFGGIYILHLQGRRVRKASNQHEWGSRYSSTLKMKAIYSSEKSIVFYGQQGVIFQKIEPFIFLVLLYIWRGVISLWLCKENNKLRDWKNIFTLHIPAWAPYTYDFVVLTSLTHPRKILSVVLQIGKAKDYIKKISFIILLHRCRRNKRVF
jgi:hypothetical protein